jgi:hypothetical protein
MSNMDLVVKRYEGMLIEANKQRDEMAQLAIEMAKENDKLTELIKKVKETLRDFKRVYAGISVNKLYESLKVSNLKDENQIMKEVVRHVINQRTTRSGLHRLVRNYLKTKNNYIPDNFKLEHYVDELFLALLENSHTNPDLALSVMTSMLVVLLDEKERINSLGNSTK